jgi:hypothetical protein
VGKGQGGLGGILKKRVGKDHAERVSVSAAFPLAWLDVGSYDIWACLAA